MYGFGGQPGILTTGLFLTSVSTPVAPVGFGPDEGTPPHDEHEPMATTAGLTWLVIASPAGAITINFPQKEMKSLRLTPARFSCAAIVPSSWMREPLMRSPFVMNR